jgi:hypothetical protein
MASTLNPLPFVKLNYGWNKGWYKLHPGGLFKTDAEKYQKVIFIKKGNTTKEIDSGVFDLDVDGIDEKPIQDNYTIPYYKIKPYNQFRFGSANNPYIEQSELTSIYDIYGLPKEDLTEEKVNELESQYYEKINKTKREAEERKQAAEAAHRKKSGIGTFFGYFRKSKGGKRKSRRKKNKQQKNTTRRRHR